MKPYRNAVLKCAGVLIFALLLPTVLFGRQNDSVLPSKNALSKRAFDRFYSMEYASAIADFEHLAKQHPDDPIANNYLATAILFTEMYRIGALDSESYASDNFLDMKPKRPLDPKVGARITELLDRTEKLCSDRIAKNPKDVDAWYARGVGRGLRSTFIGMGQKSWTAAIKSALSARRDHEKVLELDPSYVDAKMVVGIHNYIVGSLNWFWRSMVALVGVTGNKQKGLDYLREVAESHTVAAMDAKIALALFLRREQKYPEALAVVKSMADAYPKNFLSAIEYAHLLNAAGRGPEAISYYRLILKRYQEGFYPVAEPEAAAYGLGVSLRGQRRFPEAAAAFDSVLKMADVEKPMLQRASLAAGQMYDVEMNRAQAVTKYKAVVEIDKNTAEAKLARKFLEKAYKQENRKSSD